MRGMKQFAVIGLGYFGRNVLDELLELGAELALALSGLPARAAGR